MVAVTVCEENMGDAGRRVLGIEAKPGLPVRNGSINMLALEVSSRKAEWPSQVIFMNNS